MKALLIIWTVTGSGMSQTTTPMDSIERCLQAKTEIESTEVNTRVRNGVGYGTAAVTVKCVVL